MKPFAKTPKNIVTVTIEDNGDLTFLATDSADVFLEQGKTVTRRASHVEPDILLLRILFHVLRLFGNKNKIAAWTRTWNCRWRVNTKPTADYILPETYKVRQDAIDAEVCFLNRWFLEGDDAIRKHSRQAEERCGVPGTESSAHS